MSLLLLKTEVSINHFCVDEDQKEERATPEVDILIYISLKGWEIAGLLKGRQSARRLA